MKEATVVAIGAIVVEKLGLVRSLSPRARDAMDSPFIESMEVDGDSP